MNLKASVQRRGMSRDDSNSRPKQSFLLQAFDSSTASPVDFNLVIATHKAFGFSAASSNVGLSSPFVPILRKALPQGNSAILSAHVKTHVSLFPQLRPLRPLPPQT